MSHHKHTTEAFVLNVLPSREHDARVKLVTKDGEVLTAIATGLRMLKSKLRMAVVPYAHINASIVKGKEMWRLTNAQSLNDTYAHVEHREGKKALARTAYLVEKLTPGETHVGNIFNLLMDYAKTLMILSKGIQDETVKVYETQVALYSLRTWSYRRCREVEQCRY